MDEAGEMRRMFGLRVMGRNLARHKYKSLLYLLIGMLTVLLLAVYAGNMDSTKRQLARLPEAVPVQGRISNLCGNLTEGLRIREDRMEGIRTSAHVKDAVFTVRLKLGFGAFTKEEYLGKLEYYGVGMNAAAGVPGLREEEVTFLEGEDFDALQTSRKVCIMDESLMKQEGLSLGDDVMLTSFYYHMKEESSELLIDPLATDTYRIIGSMRIGEYLGSWVPAEIILPLDCVREAYHRQGIAFWADSGSFVVKDPFRLNACKDEIHDIGFLSVVSRAEFHYEGNALTLMDDTFIRSAKILNENMALLQGMLPFLGIIIFFIGYICSYLSIQGRREEYALMRSLGTGRGRSFSLLLGETVAVEALSCLLGSLAAAAFFGTGTSALCLSGALFFGAFLAGTVAALLSLNRLGVMELLSRNE